MSSNRAATAAGCPSSFDKRFRSCWAEMRMGTGEWNRWKWITGMGQRKGVRPVDSCVPGLRPGTIFGVAVGCVYSQSALRAVHSCCCILTHGTSPPQGMGSRTPAETRPSRKTYLLAARLHSCAGNHAVERTRYRFFSPSRSRSPAGERTRWQFVSPSRLGQRSM